MDSVYIFKELTEYDLQKILDYGQWAWSFVCCEQRNENMQQLVALMLVCYLCHSYTQLRCSVTEVKALPWSTLRSSVLHLSPLPQNWPADTYLLWFLNFSLTGEREFEFKPKPAPLKWMSETLPPGWSSQSVNVLCRIVFFFALTTLFQLQKLCKVEW